MPLIPESVTLNVSWLAIAMAEHMINHEARRKKSADDSPLDAVDVGSFAACAAAVEYNVLQKHAGRQVPPTFPSPRSDHILFGY